VPYLRCPGDPQDRPHLLETAPQLSPCPADELKLQGPRPHFAECALSVAPAVPRQLEGGAERGSSTREPTVSHRVQSKAVAVAIPSWSAAGVRHFARMQRGCSALRSSAPRSRTLPSARDSSWRCPTSSEDLSRWNRPGARWQGVWRIASRTSWSWFG